MTSLEMSLSQIVEDAVVRALARVNLTPVEAKPAKKTKAEPAAPVPAPSEPATSPAAADPAPAEATVSAAPMTYEELRTIVAPMLANPDTKPAVTKIVKKYCGGSLKEIAVTDYPALLKQLEGVGK
jgi:hypothetical protein